MKNISPNIVKELLPTRPLNAYKGTFGKVLIIGGSKNFPGAVSLAAMGAYRVGAGLVTLALPESIFPIVASKITEPTFIPLPEDDYGIAPKATEILIRELEKFDVVLIGNGLGLGSSTIDFFQRFIQTLDGRKVVVDADGLNILSSGTLFDKLRFDGVFTPHPGEMARLSGLSVQDIQSDRIKVAKEYSKKWSQTIILKGAETIVSSSKGEVYINPFSIPALATAGSGDVLAGMVAGFIGQGLNNLDASIVSAYIHAYAGEVLQNEAGDSGVIASDILNLLPHVISNLKK